MTTALYATIWAALALFIAGEFGKRGQTGVRPGSDRGQTPILWWASACGLALAATHILIALAINDDWNHAVAWRVTEHRTREMFGVGWGGLVAGNYAFLGWWAFDLGRWRRNPARYAATSPLVLWASRAFVLGIIASAAIGFAAGPRRWVGVLLVVAMIAAWRPLVSRTSGAEPRSLRSRRARASR
jgi:hypothetical protein